MEVLGPPVRFMADMRRYETARLQPPEKPENAIPQNPVTRQTYLAWCERSGHLERDLRNRDHGVYGPRHALPSLAKYVATGERQYGESVKEMLRNFGKWLKTETDKNGMNSQYMHEPTAIGIELRYLRKGGLIQPEDEVWIREMVLLLIRTVHVWGTPETFWRGPMHRAQGEGVMKWLAAQWYPDAPDAKQWKEYARTVWQDFWEYRDNPPNDTGYYFGILFPIVLGVELMDKTPSGQTPAEFFNDPGMMQIWERLMHTVSPDGAIVPYGAHGGWNSSAGERIWILELAARYTRDGRFRFAAHRLMNNLIYQEPRLRTHHILDGPYSTEQIALAYLFADDTLQPMQPDPGSIVLTHKETLRVQDKANAAAYLKNLDPAPDKAKICCNLIVTQKELPFKLVFRSGWNPGDLFMLVDLFPRHEPMNPTGILGLTRYGAAFTQAITSKAITDNHNLLMVEDLSGMATPVTNPNPNTIDAYYQEVTVAPFTDHALAAHAVVHVKDFCGFPMTNRREFFFIKNRFVVVKDVAEFRESFLARVGPVWKTQNISAVGDNWTNTYMTAPVAAQETFLNQPPYDLLIYHLPQPGRRLEIIGGEMGAYAYVPYQVRYVSQQIVAPEQKLHFTQLLLPHNPLISPQDLVDRIKVFTDTAEQTVMMVETADVGNEWVILNGEGAMVKAGDLETDAKQVCLNVKEGRPVRGLATAATYLTLRGKDIFRNPERADWEKK